MTDLGRSTVKVAILAFPDTVISSLTGIYDVLIGAEIMGISRDDQTRFSVEIVGERKGLLQVASGVSVEIRTTLDDIDQCDIIIVPSLLLPNSQWQKGRYPALCEWVEKVHAGGAKICSACSGIFLLAETGIFDGYAATVHFAYSQAFAETYPEVEIFPERVLVVSGPEEDLISSGASNSWHDLVLYLIASQIGATQAQEVARMFALQWHQDGLAPYIVFEGKIDHGDAEIAGAQAWLASNFAIARPVEEIIRRSRLAERTFTRRFAVATGMAPIAYVQRLRVEEAKRRLEQKDESVEDVSWRVGYEDSAFFRRLFKRTTGLSPGAYRKRFQIPEFARPTSTDGGKEPDSAA